MISLPNFHNLCKKYKSLSEQIQTNNFSSLIDIDMKEKIYKELMLISQHWLICSSQLKQKINIFCILITTKRKEGKIQRQTYAHFIPAINQINKTKQSESNNKILLLNKIKAQRRYQAECKRMQQKKRLNIYLEKLQLNQLTQNCKATLLMPIDKQTYYDQNGTKRILSINCLGCTQFYCIKMGICSQEANKCKIVLLGSIHEIKNNSLMIKYEICTLLNNGGGVLLFNCSFFSLNIVPWGQFLTQNDTSQIEKIIYSYLESIYPKPKVSQNVQVTFVPIKEDPFEKDHDGQMEKIDQDGDYYHKQKYIKGLYVTRIKVSPSNGHTTYLLTDNETHSFIPICLESSFDDQKFKIQIKGKEIVKFIKKRFTQYQYEINKNYSQKKKFLLSKKYSEFDHQCKKPDSGQFIFNQQEILKSISKKSGNQKDFRFASILVCRKERHEQIKLKLKKHKINCKIEMPFENLYQLLRMNNKAIIYHNIPLNKLRQIIRYNQEYQFDDNVTMILITDYIRLPDLNASRMLTNDDLNSLKKWLMLQHPHQQLFMWKYINEKQEIQFYLQTGSRVSSFFIYLILSHIGERVIFKNPNNMDTSEIRKGNANLGIKKKIYPVEIQLIIQ